MACDIPRTAADDARDALAALDEMAREVVHWRAHLERIRAAGAGDDVVAIALQARRCADIVGELVRDAHRQTRFAAMDAMDAGEPTDALPIG